MFYRNCISLTAITAACSNKYYITFVILKYYWLIKIIHIKIYQNIIIIFNLLLPSNQSAFYPRMNTILILYFNIYIIILNVLCSLSFYCNVL